MIAFDFSKVFDLEANESELKPAKKLQLQSADQRSPWEEI